MAVKVTRMTADQVAERLGVRRETVYAYVSRGLLSRVVDEDGRTSLFDPAEVETLARRGRPGRAGRRAGAVDVVLASGITRLRDDGLLYRGHEVTALAGHHPFEDVAELLWTGALRAVDEWTAPPAAREAARRATATLPPECPVDARLAVVTAAVSAVQPLRADLRPATVAHHARALVATFAEALPAVDGARRDAGARSVAARLWPALSPLRPTPARVRLLDAALVLLADHELATSTLAARVAASTRADPHAVVLAGLGAVAGPLHGRAGMAAHRLLLDAEERGADAALSTALEAHTTLPGFGHVLYRGPDPRAARLLELLPELAGRRLPRAVEEVADRAAAATGLAPNVDFALAALAATTRMAPGATEAVFVVARTAGWIAHALEEYGEAPLRFRATAVYAGPVSAGSS